MFEDVFKTIDAAFDVNLSFSKDNASKLLLLVKILYEKGVISYEEVQQIGAEKWSEED